MKNADSSGDQTQSEGGESGSGPAGTRVAGSQSALSNKAVTDHVNGQHDLDTSKSRMDILQRWRHTLNLSDDEVSVEMHRSSQSLSRSSEATPRFRSIESLDFDGSPPLKASARPNDAIPRLMRDKEKQSQTARGNFQLKTPGHGQLLQRRSMRSREKSTELRDMTSTRAAPGRAENPVDERKGLRNARRQQREERRRQMGIKLAHSFEHGDEDEAAEFGRTESVTDCHNLSGGVVKGIAHSGNGQASEQGRGEGRKKESQALDGSTQGDDVDAGVAVGGSRASNHAVKQVVQLLQERQLSPDEMALLQVNLMDINTSSGNPRTTSFPGQTQQRSLQGTEPMPVPAVAAAADLPTTSSQGQLQVIF